MDRKAFDAHEGLKEGRRVNPGPYKLPPQTYVSLGDMVMLVVALLAASAVIVYAPEIAEGLWKLWSAGIAAIGLIPF